MPSYQADVLAHYRAHWQVQPANLRSNRPSVQHIESSFQVLEFPPSTQRAMWTYATCGMSSWRVDQPLELHLFSASQDRDLVDLLTAVAHYHQTKHALELGHTVNFGVPWQPNSQCSHWLVSLPYLDGPTLETLTMGLRQMCCYWLVPITKAERDFKREAGLEALEKLFDQQPLDYLAPLRPSAV
jgi:hypothetical protein